MRHDASSESIHPKLQRALDCLDIRLDDELTRYRRQRVPQRGTVQVGHSLSSIIAPPKQKQIKAAMLSLGAASSPQLVGAHSVSKAFSQDQGVEDLNVNASESSTELARLALDLDLDSGAEHGALSPSETTQEPDPDLDDPSELRRANRADLTETNAPPEDYLESSEELLQSLSREESQVEVERSFLESLVTPLGVGSMLVLLLSSAMFGYVIMNPASLRNIGSIFAKRETPAIRQTTTNPVGESDVPVGVPLDSQEFVNLGLDNLATLKSAPRGNVPISAGRNSVGTASQSTLQPSASSKTQQPGSNEQSNGGAVVSPPAPSFSGGTASSTGATASSAAPPSRSQSAPARSYSSGTSSSYANRYSASSSSGGSSYSGQRPSLQSQRSYSPAPARSHNPAPARSYSPLPPIRSYSPPVRAKVYSPPVQAAPTVVSRTSNENHPYKVEIPFTGDRSLDAARKVAPDAYLRPDGKIQLGAAKNQVEAQQKAQALQNQGISADINQR